MKKIQHSRSFQILTTRVSLCELPRKVETTGKARPDALVCLYDPAQEDQSTFISKAAAELYLAMSAYSSAAVRNTRLTGVINRRNKMANTAIEHSHVSTQPLTDQHHSLPPCSVCRFIRNLRLSANTGFKEGLALHNSKVKKWKVLFYVFFSCLEKVSRGSNTVLHVETTEEEECIVIDQVKSRPKSPSVSDTVEVCSSLKRTHQR